MRTRRAGNDVVVVVSAMGKTTDDLERLAHDVSSEPTPVRWTCCSPRASASRSHCSAWPSSTSARQRCRSPARRPGSSPTLRTARPRSWRSAPTASARRSTAATSPSSPGSRGCRPSGRSPRWGRAVPTPRPSPSPPRSRPMSARSTPTSPASTPPIRASCPTPAGLERLSYDEMLEMSATGGRVLALRSVEFARNYGVPVHVRSSFTWESGTWVNEEEPGMEAPIISRGPPRTTSRRRRSRSSGCPTARASRPSSSVRSPTRTSTST